MRQNKGAEKKVDIAFRNASRTIPSFTLSRLVYNESMSSKARTFLFVIMVNTLVTRSTLDERLVRSQYFTANWTDLSFMHELNE